MNKAKVFTLLSITALVLFLLAVRYSAPKRDLIVTTPVTNERKVASASSFSSISALKLYENEVPQLIKSDLPDIKRYNVKPKKSAPPTLLEVHSNLTWFLRTLHDRFVELASPQVYLLCMLLLLY